MEIAEYREKVAELALDEGLSDGDFWIEETKLAERVLALRVDRVSQGLDPTTGEPRNIRRPGTTGFEMEEVNLPEMSDTESNEVSPT